MKAKAIQILNKIPISALWFVYVMVFFLIFLYGRTILLDDRTTYEVWKSDFTVNILILFGLYGYLVDKKVSHLPKWKAWTIWALATLALILFFKFVVGLDTWW
jgi:hypothetical protein